MEIIYINIKKMVCPNAIRSWIKPEPKSENAHTVADKRVRVHLWAGFSKIETWTMADTRFLEFFGTKIELDMLIMGYRIDADMGLILKKW